MTLLGEQARSDVFAAQVLDCRRHLHAAAMRLTRSTVDAEDLVQETLAKAYAHAGSYQPGTNLRAWLMRIELNTFYDACRARQRRPWEVPLEAGVTDLAPAMPSAEDDALARMPDPAVLAALRDLPGRFRTVVCLADVEGYSYAEIAGQLQVPLGTVMSRLHRGRKRLRAALESASQAAGLTRASVPGAEEEAA
ncbi:MAG TPA: sigma-70 family RNA polymerase sigma factor [Trebonia sp.]|nr:sigma-70 family RNA polymerase sigma factor [Trebonia sp.]